MVYCRKDCDWSYTSEKLGDVSKQEKRNMRNVKLHTKGSNIANHACMEIGSQDKFSRRMDTSSTRRQRKLPLTKNFRIMATRKQYPPIITPSRYQNNTPFYFKSNNDATDLTPTLHLSPRFYTSAHVTPAQIYCEHNLRNPWWICGMLSPISYPGPGYEVVLSLAILSLSIFLRKHPLA